jgi:hypothetical protein
MNEHLDLEQSLRVVGLASSLAYVVIACSSCSGGHEDSLVEANPDAATQLDVAGLDPLELVCELDRIGGVLGPLASTPEDAAISYAVEQRWNYGEMEVRVGTVSRQSIAFLSDDGEPWAEIVVDEASSQNSIMWQAVAVQACTQQK